MSINLSATPKDSSDSDINELKLFIVLFYDFRF